MLLGATSGPTVLWYLARGSGIAALVLLTISVVVGTATSTRWSNERWPRFVTQLVHRNASLVALVLIGIHMSAVVIDAFAPIGWKDTVVPFLSGYRPFWLGLGAIGFDLVLALVVSSALRTRMGYRAWRFLHYSAYICWPIVIVHGIGSGTDTKLGVVLVVNLVCIAAVLAAVCWRLVQRWPDRLGSRVAGAAISIVAPVALLAWMADGPLASGWASRAGTPASLLVSAAPRLPARTAPKPGATAFASPPFTASVKGTLAQSQSDQTGLVTLRISSRLTNGATGTLDLELVGQALAGGGISLQQSRITLGPAAQPNLYRGAVTSVQGDGSLLASVRSATITLRLQIVVNVNGNSQVTGSVRAENASQASQTAVRKGGLDD
jgi:hypothetical protein